MITSCQGSMKKKAIYSAVAVAILAVPFTGAQSARAEAADTNRIEEIMVTARRKEESAQETPVAVTALGAEAIYRQNITDVDDLTAAVPGINFTFSGGANNTVFSIRGRSRGVFGNALPAVNSYVNEVPLSIWGGNIPTYDVASLQVLKGPQGTLFGRNSTSGAVLIATQTPDYEFGGYVTAKVGEYSSQIFEGAVNVPIIQDKVAMRFAGQTDNRDGHTKDMAFPNKDDYGNHDRENYRISLLLDPTENLSNVTVYEHNEVDERSVPIISTGYRPGAGAIPFVPYYSGGTFRAPGTLFPQDPGAGYMINPFATGPADALIPCNGSPACDIAVVAARQDAAGPRKSWNDLPGTIDQELKSFSNTTTWDLGAFTLKNILGYREVFTHTFSDIDGTPFPMVHADNYVGNKQFTNELQISGDAFDGALEYIAGLFYLKSEPDGANVLRLQLFAQTGTPFTAPVFGLPAEAAPFTGAQGPGDFYTDISEAAFGQVSYDLGAASDALEGFSVDLGLRRTKDTAENCPVQGTEATSPLPTESDCTQRIDADFEKTTYNLGLNYQMTDDILLYAATRTGYRAGGLNSPIYGGQLVPFQSFDPEEVQDFELGMKSDWSLGDIFGRLNVAVYTSDYSGVHYAIPTSGLSTQVLPLGVDGDGDPSNNPSGGLFTGNAGDATVEGIEVDLIAQLTNSLEVSVGGSYMDKDLDTKLTLPPSMQPFADQLATPEDIRAFVFLASPDWSYNASATYTLPLDESIGEVALTARYFAMSEVHYGGNIYADDYGTIDLRADWFGLMGSSFDAAFYVTNASDEEVIIAPSSSGSNIGINSGIYNEPRMWGASVRYSF